MSPWATEGARGAPYRSRPCPGGLAETHPFATNRSQRQPEITVLVEMPDNHVHLLVNSRRKLSCPSWLVHAPREYRESRMHEHRYRWSVSATARRNRPGPAGQLRRWDGKAQQSQEHVHRRTPSTGPPRRARLHRRRTTTSSGYGRTRAATLTTPHRRRIYRPCPMRGRSRRLDYASRHASVTQPTSKCHHPSSWPRTSNALIPPRSASAGTVTATNGNSSLKTSPPRPNGDSRSCTA